MLIGAWWWKPEDNGVFSASLTYLLLEEKLLTTNEVRPFEKKSISNTYERVRLL